MKIGVTLSEEEIVMITYALKEMSFRRADQALEQNRPSLAVDAEEHRKLADWLMAKMTGRKMTAMAKEL